MKRKIQFSELKCTVQKLILRFFEFDPIVDNYGLFLICFGGLCPYIYKRVA